MKIHLPNMDLIGLRQRIDDSQRQRLLDDTHSMLSEIQRMRTELDSERKAREKAERNSFKRDVFLMIIGAVIAFILDRIPDIAALLI